MKKIMSKILIIFILFVMLFEVVFSSNYALAVSEEFINGVANLTGGLVSILYWPKRIMIVGLSAVIDMLTAKLAESSGTNYESETLIHLITPFDIFFNKYKLLDVNFFDIDGVEEGSIPYTMRVTISGWFYVMRTIAASILLIILIYVGIRMAISTVAEEKAKYKKMLFDWVCSLALIFVLQYIAIFTIYTNNAIVNALRSMLTDTAVEDTLTSTIVDIATEAIAGVGIPSMAAVLVTVFIVFQTIAFLIAYINRMLKVGFLIMISPLISITYSIDKMGDGKAQALNKWLAEFIFTILIQPFHCLTYIAFVRTAFSLITSPDVGLFSAFSDIADLVKDQTYNELVNAVLAVLCLKFINDGEKVVRKIFGFQDDNSGTSLAAGMAVGMLAVKNIKKAGNTARKGMNYAKNTASNLKAAYGKDMKGIRERNPKLDKAMNKLENFGDKTSTAINSGISKAGKALKIDEGMKKLGEIQNSVKNSGFGKFAGKTISKAKTIDEKLKGPKIREFIKSKNSVASAIGIMSAAMMYSSGSSGAMEALGMGSAVNDAASEFFASSASTLGDAAAKEQQKADDIERAALQDEVDNLGKPGDKDTDYTSALRQYDKANGHDQAAEAARAEAMKAKESMNKDASKEELAKAQKLYDEKMNEYYIESEKAKRAREEAAKLDPSGAAEADYNSGRYTQDEDGKSISFDEGLEKERTKAQTSLRDFNSFDQKMLRYHKRARGHQKSELLQKKNEIMQKLAKIKLAQKNDGDSNVNNTLTTEDMDSIERTAELLTKNIEMGVLQNGFSQERQAGLVRSSLGLDSEASGSMMQELYAATSQYESMQRDNRIAEQHELYRSVGGKDETLIDRELRRNSRHGTKTRSSNN